MQQQKAERVRGELIRLCHTGLDSRTLRIEILKRLRTVLPIDLAGFMTIDPATLLLTGAVLDDPIWHALPQLIENEFTQDDVNKCVWLARTKTPVVSLGQATRGDFAQSRRYREILAPLRQGDELRAVLSTGEACWGFMCLSRDHSRPPFTLTEAAYLARLTPHFAEGLRNALLLGSTAGPTVSEEPGLVLLADDLTVVATTPAAERWLAEAGEADWPRQQALPSAVAVVVARLQALERNSPPQPALLPRVRLRTRTGHWLVLHASRLSGQRTQGHIAVILEVARPTEMAPLIMQAYDLSKRESEIMQCVVRGRSTAEIAEAFHISSNTVQDHLKAIFEKVGVRSRRELVAHLFAEQYQPRITSGRDLDGNGWFT